MGVFDIALLQSFLAVVETDQFYRRRADAECQPGLTNLDPRAPVIRRSLLRGADFDVGRSLLV